MESMRAGWIAAAVVAAAVVATTIAAIDSRAQAPLGPNPVLVELFTSQG